MTKDKAQPKEQTNFLSTPVAVPIPTAEGAGAGYVLSRFDFRSTREGVEQSMREYRESLGKTIWGETPDGPMPV